MVDNVNANVVNMKLNLKYDGKSYNAISRITNGSWGWTLTRTFDLSTNLVVSQEKVNKLERQVEKLEDQMDKMMDMDEEIVRQHEDLFKQLSEDKKDKYQY